MENKILHKRSNILGDSPDLNDLQSGELAINTGDGYLFFKKVQNQAIISANLSIQKAKVIF